jgi:proteasome component ECM29
MMLFILIIFFPSGTLLSVLRERLTKLLSENDTKAQQKILVSLGHISWNEMSFPHLNDALDLIFSLSRSKVVTQKSKLCS